MSVQPQRKPLSDLPIGTGATGTRLESDSMGTIEVPAEHYWLEDATPLTVGQGARDHVSQ